MHMDMLKNVAKISWLFRIFNFGGHALYLVYHTKVCSKEVGLSVKDMLINWVVRET